MPLEKFGELVPISRPGGQGRVHRPSHVPVELGHRPVVVKLYRRRPPADAADVLEEMVRWSGSLESEQHARLQHVAAWPVAAISDRGVPVGIAMRDVTSRFAAPFLMPSGRRERVLLALEHLLGPDSYLQSRGLDVRLDTAKRIQIAERISGALAFLHRNAIVASDIAPSNLLISFGHDGVAVCFIDCDSMVFRGRQALPSVETGDWEMPSSFAEPPRTRAADAYKLGLTILRLFARSHDARVPAAHAKHVPAELHGLLARSLGANPANRPTAGEWQRVLRQLAGHTWLAERYPGPAPANGRTIPARGPAHRGTAPAGGVASAAPASATRSPRPGARSRSTPTGARWLRPAVAVLWLIAGTVVLALLFSRLFAAVVPTTAPEGSGVGSGISGAAPAHYRYYYQPAGGVPGVGRAALEGTQLPQTSQ